MAAVTTYRFGQLVRRSSPPRMKGTPAPPTACRPRSGPRSERNCTFSQRDSRSTSGALRLFWRTGSIPPFSRDLKRCTVRTEVIVENVLVCVFQNVRRCLRLEFEWRALFAITFRRFFITRARGDLLDGMAGKHFEQKWRWIDFFNSFVLPDSVLPLS